MPLAPVFQIAVGLFVLGLLVLVHELGHFVFAKLFGIRVISFSIGFGKPLLRTSFRGTEYRISMIPFGGFVHMAGEHPDEAQQMKDDDFQARPVWQRAVVAAAGPLANYISALFFLWLALVIGTHVPTYRLSTVVGDVSDSSAAAVAGIRVGDSLIAVNGRPVSSWESIAEVFDRQENSYRVTVIRGEELLSFTLDSLLTTAEGLPRHRWAGMYPSPPCVVGNVVAGRPAERAGLRAGDTVTAVDGEPIRTWSQFTRKVVAFDTSRSSLKLRIARPGHGIVEIEARPEYDSTQRRFMLGAVADEGPKRLVRLSPLKAIPAAFRRANDIIVLVFNTLVKLVLRKVSPRELAGPIGIVQMSGGVAFLGITAMLNFMALISVNLALLNLLPLVITDGGLLLFLGLEALRGRPLPLKYQVIVTRVAIALIVVLFVFVTLNDILRIPRYMHMTGR